MLIDTIDVIFKGGNGGNGLVSFGKMTHSGPDGGNGGDGGDLYVIAANDITLLNQFSAENEVSAENGEKGGQNKSSGKAGKDLDVFLPVGTSIIDKKSGMTLLELTKAGQSELLCKGGNGGKGNWEFRSSTNTTPMYAEFGGRGEKKELTLSLRLIADFGLIGLPNAGKTSLLNELTNAKAKTGNYAFTTLSANIGICNEKCIADIPGLIEGASTGKGLGIKFLKHIEKVEMLLHCISADSIDPIKDYETVRNEIASYNMSLLRKPEVVLITKSDLVEEKELKELVKIMKKVSKKVLTVSIHDWNSLEKLKKIIV